MLLGDSSTNVHALSLQTARLYWHGATTQVTLVVRHTGAGWSVRSAMQRQDSQVTSAARQSLSALHVVSMTIMPGADGA